MQTRSCLSRLTATNCLQVNDKCALAVSGGSERCQRRARGKAAKPNGLQSVAVCGGENARSTAAEPDLKKQQQQHVTNTNLSYCKRLARSLRPFAFDSDGDGSANRLESGKST